MSEVHPRPLRRIVTGHDAQGRSCVIFDSAAPNIKPRPGSPETYYCEVWTIDSVPADISRNEDDGFVDQPVAHAPPPHGARFRIVQGPKTRVHQEPDDAREQAAFDSMNRSGMSERRHSDKYWHMHKSRTVDYAMCLGGERVLALDDSETTIARGDVVIQLANFHAWKGVPGKPGWMGYIMIGAEYPNVAGEPHK
jgi:hypothetical protein